ncbi:hypothetical protein Dtox_0376 [Desulfofarcimen acetoxidans DSM 771]|uniref:Uncharacterized protein n=1 Tax=Desulfofarcimen acetoxidans (strain ATCC 49208 / DSM 771 / KCTC 5769 / VKM B-1644 / 5575) TaxID=485916 RepID=C8W4X2_DESAS|nr:hypothetical protein Dtox_0376 [Desulfofarcimen acetoxidans DSM 771]
MHGRNACALRRGFTNTLLTTRCSDQQEQILKALGCESIVDVKYVKNILQKAENWL